MDQNRPSCNAYLPSFFIIEYFLFFAVTVLFLLRIPSWSTPVFLLLIPALFVYPLFYIAPSLLLSSAVAAASRPLESSKPFLRKMLIGATAWSSVFISTCC